MKYPMKTRAKAYALDTAFVLKLGLFLLVVFPDITMFMPTLLGFVK